mmetsp:Transcript_8709/g.28919  ORF Transcript_8709/g.28919 Transcript_8709/m.28919 type:complete len:250 (-) Transcript_8709:469-1218(-)
MGWPRRAAPWHSGSGSRRHGCYVLAPPRACPSASGGGRSRLTACWQPDAPTASSSSGTSAAAAAGGQERSRPPMRSSALLLGSPPRAAARSQPLAICHLRSASASATFRPCERSPGRRRRSGCSRRLATTAQCTCGTPRTLGRRGSATTPPQAGSPRLRGRLAPTLGPTALRRRRCSSGRTSLCGWCFRCARTTACRSRRAASTARRRRPSGSCEPRPTATASPPQPRVAESMCTPSRSSSGPPRGGQS